MEQYAYIRVSTKEQNIDRQRIAIEPYHIAEKNIYCDYQSGKNFARPAYQRMIQKLQPGDLVIVKSIDRLGRNYNDILIQWQYITKELRADILVLDMELLDTRKKAGNLTGTLIADLVLQIFAYVAQTEREFIIQRQSEGIAAAKRNGKKFGRPQTQIPDKFEEIAGEGLVAYFGARKVLCGNTKLLQRFNVEYGGYTPTESGSEVLVADNGLYMGQLLINDTLKEDAKEAIASLKAQGLVTAMLTGDAQKEAQAVAKEAGIDEVRAQLLPQDKLSELNMLRNKYGPVMFVGDGINDAPVLAGADAGAAMGSGADAAIEAADVVFMNSEVKAIPQAIAIARATGAIAWQNVIFALAVKVVIMIAGLMGYASMWAAVFADTGVSLLCVLNSIRILYKKI